MKKALIGVGVVVVLLVLVVVGGGFLAPAAHTASVKVSIKQPPEAVWATLSDLGTWPSWNSGVATMERLPDRDGHPVWKMSDGDMEMPSEVVEATAPAGARPGRLVTRILPDAGLAFGGTWTWEVAPDGAGGTTVTVTENGEIHSPVFRFFSRWVIGYTATAERFLRALAKKFGEDVAPVIVASGV